MCYDYVYNIIMVVCVYVVVKEKCNPSLHENKGWSVRTRSRDLVPFQVLESSRLQYPFSTSLAPED